MQSVLIIKDASGELAMRTALTTATALVLAAASVSAAYAAPCSGLYNYTGTIVTCTVSAGDYSITAYGAKGGNSEAGSGGSGAKVAAVIDFSQSETLELLVGGTGVSDTQNRGGGGGGSFVVEVDAGPTYTPLVIAGGGGGGAALSDVEAASEGPSGANGGGTNPGNGGTGGDGGTGSTYAGGGGSSSGAGGGGFYTDGGSGSGGSAGGASFLDGGAGGVGFDGGLGGGGFGGGGASGSDQDEGGFGGGGGGGYSGGGGGGYAGGGGGGGSFVDPSFTLEDLIGAFNAGPGEIYITESSEISLPGVPEPASLTVFGAALLALGFRLRGKRRSA